MSVCEVLMSVGESDLREMTAEQLRSVGDALAEHANRVRIRQAYVFAELERRGYRPEVIAGPLTPKGQAVRLAETVAKLDCVPGARDALDAGRVGFDHVAALVDAADRLDDEQKASLLVDAERLSLQQVRGRVRRKAAPKPKTSTAANKPAPDGGMQWHLDLNPIDAEIVHNAITMILDDHYQTAGRPNAEALAPYFERVAAAFVDMAQRALGGKKGAPRPEIVVVIDYETMFSDAEAAGLCTTINGERLSPGEVRRMLANADVYPLVLGGDSEVLDLGRTKRLFSREQRRALAAVFQGCGLGLCEHDLRNAQYHHLIDWLKGGNTNIAEGIPLCPFCHAKCTNEGWSVAVVAGEVITYRPDGTEYHRRPIRQHT